MGIVQERSVKGVTAGCMHIGRVWRVGQLVECGGEQCGRL